MKLSIVLPAFNEEANIAYITSELIKTLSESADSLEILFVDDGSKDNTWKEIQEQNKKNKNVRGLRVSRNFGHQIAVLAGLKESTGDFVAIMDSDGQHPPATVIRMLEEQKKGFDIVNTIQKSNADAAFFKKISSKLYAKLLNYLSDVDIKFEHSDFRLMSRRSVDAYLELNEQNRFSRGLMSWIGFPQTSIEYEAVERFAGVTKWSPRKLLKLGIDGITSFSSKPLRLSFTVGVIAIVIGILYSIYAVVVYFTGNTIPGWPSLLITILLLGGFQLFTLGIVGEYISRIFNETKRRPHFFIQDKC